MPLPYDSSGDGAHYLQQHDSWGPGAHEGVRQSQDCKSLRIARYLAVRAEAIRQLLKRLATVPETIEVARAAGLTIPQVWPF
jgi:hypothetical protein